VSNEQFAAVILAAGSSSRMGGIKKEYQGLKSGDTALASSVRVFLSVPNIQIIVIVVSENEENQVRDILPPEFLTSQKPKIIFTAGGNTRRESVFNALSVLGIENPQIENLSYVLIHDGARPWISLTLIEKLIEAVKKYDAVIPLVTLIDTPKEITEEREEGKKESEKGTFFIKRHLKRTNVGLAQTPQVFKFPEIFYAHEKARQVTDEEFTDDAEIWNRFVGKVAAIPGEIENKKITFPEDIL
jgi:2-C-methyl-D-erythritol 4-phosphate cytidylyltransferase